MACVVPGHAPLQVAAAVVDAGEACGASRGGLVQLGMNPGLDESHLEPIGAGILDRREGATRGWLKIQDGCDRKCSFCATRLARGTSRSRPPGDIIVEARALSLHHPELVLTGIHIGHYGRDLAGSITLSILVSVSAASRPRRSMSYSSTSCVHRVGVLRRIYICRCRVAPIRSCAV